jgi:excisionase family DNA binding protein
VHDLTRGVTLLDVWEDSDTTASLVLRGELTGSADTLVVEVEAAPPDRSTKLSGAQVYRLISQKKLPHIRMGKSVRVRPADLESWLARQLVLDATRVEDRIKREFARKQ